MLTYYAGRRVLITGGSSGIGKAAAVFAARAGAHVHIVGRDPSRLETALADIRAAAPSPAQRIGGTPLDVGDRLAVAQAAPSVLDALGGVDVVINNAGVEHIKTILDCDPEDFERVISTNFLGAVWITRAFLPTLLSQPEGRIAFVSSLAGLLGVYGYGAYAPSKFAITGFVEVLRQELVGSNVRVTIVFPPDVDTPMLRRELKVRPPGTTAVAGSVAALEPDAVAMDLLRAIAKGRYERIVGFNSRLTMWAARHFPWLARFVINRSLRSVLVPALQGPATPLTLSQGQRGLPPGEREG